MLSYKVYLSKSEEVVAGLEESYTGKLKTDDIQRVYHGRADGDECIPAVYYGKGYYCCVIVLSEFGEDGTPTYDPTYEMIIR